MKRRTVLSGLVLFCGSSMIACRNAKLNTEAQLPLPVLRIWRDFSSSMNERDIEIILPNVLESIKRNSNSISGVEVVRFANEDESIWSAPVERFIWDEVTHIEIAKTAPKKVPHGVELARQIFTAAKNKNLAEEKIKRDQRQQVRIKEHVEPKLKKLQDYLGIPPTEEAPCTKFGYVGRRIVDENLPYNVLIGDGWNDCGVQNDAITGMSGKLVIILTMRKGETALHDEVFLQRKDEMQRLFPDAVIVPIYGAQAALERMLKSN